MLALTLSAYALWQGCYLTKYKGVMQIIMLMLLIYPHVISYIQANPDKYPNSRFNTNVNVSVKSSSSNQTNLQRYLIGTGLVVCGNNCYNLDRQPKPYYTMYNPNKELKFVKTGKLTMAAKHAFKSGVKQSLKLTVSKSINIFRGSVKAISKPLVQIVLPVKRQIVKVTKKPIQKLNQTLARVKSNSAKKVKELKLSYNKKTAEWAKGRAKIAAKFKSPKKALKPQATKPLDKALKQDGKQLLAQRKAAAQAAITQRATNAKNALKNKLPKIEVKTRLGSGLGGVSVKLIKPNAANTKSLIDDLGVINKKPIFDSRDLDNIAKSSKISKPKEIKGFSNKNLLNEHWLGRFKNGKLVKNGHAKEFPNIKNKTDYEKASVNFFKNPPKETLTGKRDASWGKQEGDIVQYHSKTGTFGIISKEGNVRTMFKPKRGKGYFYEQF